MALNKPCLFTEVLPLVEFFLEDDISDEEALQLLESEPPRRKPQQKQDGWRQETSARILVIIDVQEFNLSNYALLRVHHISRDTHFIGSQIHLTSIIQKHSNPT